MITPRIQGAAFWLWLGCTVGLGTIAINQANSAWRDSHEPNCLVIPLRVDRRDYAQVFYDVGRGFNALDCATLVVWPTREGREMRFPVPRKPLRALRFDPLATEGSIEVGSPRLETASGRVIEALPLSAIKPQNQIAEFRQVGPILRIATTPAANDPMLTVELASPLNPHAVSLPWAWLAVTIVAAAGVLFFTRQLRDLLRSAWCGIVAVREPAGKAGFWCGALVVATLQLWLLWPLHRVLDVPLFDEAGYMGWGALWSHNGSPGRYLFNCPLYVLQYALELKFLGHNGAAYFFNQYVFKIAGAVLLYMVLARWWRCWQIAFLFGLMWVNAAFQSQQLILVYHAALFWLLLAILLADEWPLASIGCLLLGICVRQEYQFATAAFGLWLIWQKRRGRITWGEWAAKRAGTRLVGITACLLLFGLFGYIFAHIAVAGSGARAWFAFQQHYSVRAVSAGEITGVEPWIDYPRVIGRDFPGAHSLLEAWQINSAAVSHHIASNLRRAPSALFELVQPLPAQRHVVIFLLLALGLVAWWWRSRVLAPVAGPSPSRAIAVCALLALIPGLVIFAKDAYLLAALPAVTLAMSWTVWRLVGLLPLAPWKTGWLPCGIVLLAALATAFTPRSFEAQSVIRDIAENVAALDFHWPAGRRVKLLAVPASSYQLYLGTTRCEAIEGIVAVRGNARGESSLASRLRLNQPDVVLITPEWTNSASFDQAEASSLLRPPQWRSIPLTHGIAFFAQPN
jgi:hypothetical protein